MAKSSLLQIQKNYWCLVIILNFPLHLLTCLAIQVCPMLLTPQLSEPYLAATKLYPTFQKALETYYFYYGFSLIRVEKNTMKFQGDADTRAVCIKIISSFLWGCSFRGDDLLS